MLTAQLFITAAVGMGAATTLLTMAETLRFEPLPFRAPVQLVVIWERVNSSVVAISGADMADFANATHDFFESLRVFAVPNVWLIDGRGSIRVRACYIQASAMSDLGIHPVLGRGVHPGDTPVGSASSPPIWISYELWQTRYGGSRSVIGTTVAIGDRASGGNEFNPLIVGVVPSHASIALPFMKNTADVWYLISSDVVARSRKAGLFFGVGRLRPGIGIPRAQHALAVEAERLGQQYGFDVGKRPVLRTLESLARGPSRRRLWLLALGVGVVFVVSYICLVILLGIEGRQRWPEIAMDRAIGAGRGHFLVDVATGRSVLIVLSMGPAAGVAAILLRIVVQLLPPVGLGGDPTNPHIDTVALICCGALTLGVALISSAILVKSGPRPAPQSDSGSGTGPESSS